MYKGTYTLIGGELSMFTRKLEAQLRYQNIPYEWNYRTMGEASAIQERAGTRFIPLLDTPDGWLLNDTITIGPMLNDRFRNAPVIPNSPVQRAACFIIEDYFNHWLPRHALHSRWCYPDNVIDAGINFGINMMHGKSIDDSLSDEERDAVKDTGNFMRDSFGITACETQGAGVDKQAAVRGDFDKMMGLFKAHFAEHDFLFGSRASIADFALVGPAKAHFLQDPEPRAWLAEQDNEKMLEAYVERVWNNSDEAGEYLADDAIPETLIPILQHAKANYQVFAMASIQAAAKGEKTFNLDLGYGEFTARSMKRLDKARLHVRDEISGLNLTGSVLESTGVLELYQQGPIV